MTQLFLDTNVAIDYLDRRDPFYEHAFALFELAASGAVKLYISPLSIATAAYVLRRQPVPLLRAKLRTLAADLTIVDFSEQQLLDGLDATSPFTDIEDAFQHAAAVSAGCEVILTRNPKDFTASVLPVMSAADYVAQHRSGLSQ